MFLKFPRGFWCAAKFGNDRSDPKTWVSCLLPPLTSFEEVNHHFTFFLTGLKPESLWESLISFTWDWIQMPTPHGPNTASASPGLKAKRSWCRLQEIDTLFHLVLGACHKPNQPWLPVPSASLPVLPEATVTIGVFGGHWGLRGMGWGVPHFLQPRKQPYSPSEV